MANVYEFTKTDVRSITRSYEKGMGLAAIAEEWGVSTPVIRRVLEGAGTVIRGRGRPRNGA